MTPLVEFVILLQKNLMGFFVGTDECYLNIITTSNQLLMLIAIIRI